MSEIIAFPVKSEVRDRVNAIEYEMLNADPDKFVQVDLPVRHHFSQGVYARELFIPKGTLLTGKIHKYTNLNILSMGEMSVLTDDGVKRVRAPFTVVSPPGTKRIAYAHEDCIWTTILGTSEKDPEKIEDQFTAKSEEEYLMFCKQIEETKWLS